MRRKTEKNPIHNDHDILPKVDRISELPDDVLVSILSHLTFREATAAKTLSTRWRRLDVPANVISFDYDSIKEYPNHYISRVNHALHSYEGGQRIDKFKIDIPSVSEAVSYFEKWVEFAFLRDTDTLDIRIIYGKLQISYTHCFCFSSFVKKYSTTLPGLKYLYLKDLSLKGVYFTNYEAILTTLVALERLSIESPRSGPRGQEIRLLDSRLKLKHLNISNFGAEVTSVRLYQLMNLVSVRIHGLESYLLYLENCPKLVHVSIVKARFHDPQFGFLSGYLFNINVYAQLLRLRLYIDLLDHEAINEGKYVTPNFTELKHMELDIAIDGECLNHQLFHWVKTCPSMEELQIKFLWPSVVSYKYRKQDKDLVEREAALDKLRTLRLSGYRGTASELEFVLYVVKNATNLKDLIVVEDGHAATPPKKFLTRAFEHLRSLIPTCVNFVSV